MKLPDEIWLEISDKLIKDGELRSLFNLNKALGWKTDKKYFIKELMKERFISKLNYEQQMIDFWERTGIDDGVPTEYLKKKLNKKTRIFKTIWALTICNGNFYNIANKGLFDYHNYTNNLVEDNRTYTKYYKYKNKKDNIWLMFPCKKCVDKYIKEHNIIIHKNPE